MFFGKNIKYLRIKLNLNQDEMQAHTGIKRATWSEYERSSTEPRFKEIIRISDFFGVPIDDLFRKDLELEESKGNLIVVPGNAEKGNLKGNPKGNLKEEKHPFSSEITLNIVNEAGVKYGPKSGIVPITDISVAAGGGHYNPDFIENVQSLTLPPQLIKRNHSYLCVKIKGPSMSPTLQDGGYVVIRNLDRSEWATMPDERLFVISDKEGKSYLKRVKNRFKQGFVVLKSDNPDQASHPNFNLSIDEIHTIWYVEWYLSAKMPNIHDQYYTRLQKLEDVVDGLVAKLK